MIKTLPYESLQEIAYHTWLIKAGHHTFIYSGPLGGIKKAKKQIEDMYPPSYGVHVKKVA